MGANQILAIVLGITLVTPQLLNAYELATATNIPIWDFGAFQIQMIGYQSQVIPAILIGFTFVFLERLFTKITPDAIKMIVVPFCSLVPSVFLAHAIVGPIGRLIGTGITIAVNAGFQSTFGWLVAGVFGVIYPVLVVTGVHHAILVLDLQLISDMGGTYVWPIRALCNISQGSAVLSYYLMHRKSKKDEQISVPAFISAYLGVTEPALFGINLKYFYPLIAGLIGSGAAGIISMSFNCTANSIGISGLPAILSMRIDSVVPYLIAMLAAVLIPLIITPILSKTPLSKVEAV
jgi:PTS system trehalose-specific IIC component